MYIAFLRGINVSGKNKISMKDLVSVFFENSGYTNVKHYLNTGNIIFDSINEVGDSITAISENIEKLVKSNFDLDIHVLVMTSKELFETLDGFPFESENGKNLYITIMKSEPVSTLLESMEFVKTPDDRIELSENILYLFVPSGYGKSKLNNNFIEKKGKVIATTRNLNTFKKLKSML